MDSLFFEVRTTLTVICFTRLSILSEKKTHQKKQQQKRTSENKVLHEQNTPCAINHISFKLFISNMHEHLFF